MSPARMRTMTALRQFGRTSLHHEAITSITYQRSIGTKRALQDMGRAGQKRFEDQTNVSCRNPVVKEWSDP
jgi:hypothetical protein